ncbi:N-acetyltransferase [Vibrio vulnificus]|uniref:GNAT family N-acetyltransferase n=1 Tax=Vibrio vulnificus TaxID=672 RepID=UPI0018DD6F91|nr:GNAT family protein [Vibrio vulnificus]EGR0791484.1 N-acetyltransferase [Vibrio vulnificus]EGR0800025.1 N-acetyltransferase [Vibrio vulnificus]EGR0817371.1 N-acetyltransferase [Vibrio vulnificus]EGR0828997.1 N-acetyltransferase [Vibrio vulnificus]EGR0849888.1 N-acetyltransferase [Vibrio vulnificus]
MFTLKVDDSVSLALVEPKFAVNYLKIVSQERDYLSQWLAWPIHADSEKFFLDFIKQSLHDYAEGKSLVCAICFDGELVGNISFNTINNELQKVEIGYWLSQAFQGRGIISKSVLKLIDIAFNELGMQKVQIAAAVENTPSRKVCKRLGFNFEGIITRAENINGRVVDHAIYGLSRESFA